MWNQKFLNESHTYLRKNYICLSLRKCYFQTEMWGDLMDMHLSASDEWDLAVHAKHKLRNSPSTRWMWAAGVDCQTFQLLIRGPIPTFSADFSSHKMYQIATLYQPSIVVQRLGYLAFTQETRVRFPAMEFILPDPCI